jgi:hypothetical protein
VRSGLIMTRSAIVLAIMMLLVAVLPPRPLAAQNSSCDLSGLLPETMRAFLGTPWVAERSIQVGEITLLLRFCAPQTKSVVAEQMFNLVERALPILNDLTDVRLDGSHIRTIYLDTSERLYSRDVDGYINQFDQITLHPLSLDSTVIHELAHYWSDRERFREPWMVEAYAEYLTSLAAVQLGIVYTAPRSIPACNNLALQAWQPQPRETAVCAYSVGPQVLHALAAEVGAANLRQAIGLLSRQPGGVDSWQLLSELERGSLKNLSPLLRDAVFMPTFHPLLDERAAVRARFISAAQLAAQLGTTLPPSIALELDAWQHLAAASQLDLIDPVLHGSELTWRRCAELGLACVPLWAHTGPDLASWEHLSQQLAGAPQLLSSYEELRRLAAEQELGMPDILQQVAASLNFDQITTLQAASIVLGQVGTSAARCAEYHLSCRELWQAAWERGDNAAVLEATSTLEQLLDEVAQVEQRCAMFNLACRASWQASFNAGSVDAALAQLGQLAALFDEATRIERRCAMLDLACRSFWQAGFQSGGIEVAQARLAQLATLFGEVAGLEQRCSLFNVPCRGLWQAGFQAGGVNAAQAQLEQLAALLSEAARVEAACATVGWPCGEGWRVQLADAGPSAARDLLVAQEAALPELSAIATAIGPPTQANPSADPDALQAARAAFARGEIVEAQRLAEATRSAHEWASGLQIAAVTLGLGVVIVSTGLWWWRARRRRMQRAGAVLPGPVQTDDDTDLLTQLLLKHPPERSDTG